MAIRKTIWVSGNSLPTLTEVLESPAGQDSLSASVVSSDYISMSFSMTANANAYLYVDMSSITDYTIQSGDYLEYDIYWETAGNIKIAVDLMNSAQSQTLRGAGAVDQNGFNPHADTDISSRASGVWYHRKIPITTLSGGGGVGSTIGQYCLVCEYDSTGTVVGRIKNILITDGNQNTTTSTSLSTSSTSSSTSTTTSMSTSTSISTSTSSTSLSTSSTSSSTSTSFSTSTSTSQSTSTTSMIHDDYKPVARISNKLRSQLYTERNPRVR